ncbi:2-isopropylmalate synthase [Candidatus Palauibacter sp.]|uniref:2-isopropylmalate synthase n=1 Tax=Candidatus Palauibacter sp. TaxID=3101350 RepID=UPI003B5BFDE3
MRPIAIFDTTLRDGEQAPGFSMSVEDKLRLARQLERLRVDVVEAGFPIASDGDFEAVRRIANEVREVSIAALARTSPGDIRRCWEALEGATRPRIHTFLATSDIHLRHKLLKSRAKALDTVVEAVELARSLCDDVEFSAEDAGRSDPEYLRTVVAAAIEAGATVVNIPDTVGYCLPAEYGALIASLGDVEGIEDVTISTHCHDDLGLAVANSLAGVLNGARQVECAVNGIGERAGNASLEEVVMALQVRSAELEMETGVNTRELYRTSQLLSSVTGMDVQPNKAIVGKNAFAHEAGIHQDGVLKHAATYEIMTPESVGVPQSRLVLGKHSGRHALAARYRELGYQLSEADLARAYTLFTKLADRKQPIYDDDLRSIVNVGLTVVPTTFALKQFRLVGQSDAVCAVTLGVEKGGALYTGSATGDGPVDAIVRAVNQIVAANGRVLEYSAKSVTRESDAVGEVFMRVDFDGTIVVGRAASTDLNIAAARSYLDAMNKVARLVSRECSKAAAVEFPGIS